MSSNEYFLKTRNDLKQVVRQQAGGVVVVVVGGRKRDLVGCVRNGEGRQLVGGLGGVGRVVWCDVGVGCRCCRKERKAKRYVILVMVS